MGGESGVPVDQEAGREREEGGREGGRERGRERERGRGREREREGGREREREIPLAPSTASHIRIAWGVGGTGFVTRAAANAGCCLHRENTAI